MAATVAALLSATALRCPELARARATPGTDRSLRQLAPSRFRIALQPLQVAAHLRGMLVAQIDVFLQRLVDDVFQPCRHFMIQPHRRHWRAIHDGFANHGRAFAVEGNIARRHFVQHCAKREKIAARIQFPPAHLLRRHVGDGAQHRAGAGQVRLVQRLGVVGSVALADPRPAHLRQTEVENLGVAALGDEDVRRLDVAMDDALGVRGVERIRDLNRQRDKLVILHRTRADGVLERQAIEKLHGDERLAFMLVNVVNGADVGMIQRRSGLRLALEAGQSLRIFGDIVGQEFQRDKAAELEVLRLVNHAHAAAAQLLDDAVMRDGLTDHVCPITRRESYVRGWGKSMKRPSPT